MIELLRDSIAISQKEFRAHARSQRNLNLPSYATNPDSPELVDHMQEEDQEEEPGGQDVSVEDLSPITSHEIQMLRKVHVNLSHPPMEQFLWILRAAGAKSRVIDYARNKFQCDHCDLQRQPKSRRKAAVPPTYAFNKVVGIDLFYITYERKQVPFLNCVDHGTGFQMCAMIRDQQNEVPTGNPGSHLVWKAFQNTWLRYLFEPEIVITDDGPEFADRFARGLEQHGCFHHTTDRQSPWQNARAERHGGWVKEKLQAEISSGDCVIFSEADLEEYVSSLTSTLDNGFMCGG